MSLRISAICGLLAPVTFIAGWFFGGLAQPSSYSWVHDDISDLGALTADSPWLYNQIGANLTGLLMLALTVGCGRRSGRDSRRDSACARSASPASARSWTVF